MNKLGSPFPSSATIERQRQPAGSASALILHRESDGPGSRVQPGKAAGAVTAVWPPGALPSDVLTAMARICLLSGSPTTRRIEPVKNGRSITVTASPLTFNAQGIALSAVAMIVDDRAIERAATPLQAQSESIAQPVYGDKSQDNPLAPQNRTRSVLRLLGLINTQSQFNGAAIAFVSELARQTGTQRVSLGFLADATVKIVAVSGTTHINPKSPMLHDLGLAMTEAVNQAATIAYPEDSKGQAKITLAHSRFTVRHNSQTLCTIPIVVSQDGERSILGAVTLEFGNTRPLDSDAIHYVEHATALVAPTMDAYRQLAHPVGGRLARHLNQRHRKKLIGSHRGRAILIAAFTSLVLALALIPLPYHITASARLEGASQQILTAPVKGYIGSVKVRPGERIVAGQTLIELDDRELNLQARKWRSEESQIQKRYGQALADESQGDIAIERARLAQIRAELRNTEDQLARMRLIAPFDGLVLSGDLSQSLGAPVKQGESLVTIAPLNKYRVIAEVDERDIAMIRTDQGGQIVLPALSGETLYLKIERVTPIAVIRNGANVFEVQAQLLNEAGTVPDNSAIRPGLEGIAKISVGKRPLLASFTYRLRNSVRMMFWKWWA